MTMVDEPSAAVMEGEMAETERLIQDAEQESAPRINMYANRTFSAIVLSTIMISIGENFFFLAAPRFYKNTICCSSRENACTPGFSLVPEDQCNQKFILDELGSVRFYYFMIQAGVAIVALLVWCFLVAFHWLRLRRILILAQCGAVIAEASQAYIFWKNGSLSIRWIWATPFISILLGGGGMTYLVLRDCALRQQFGQGHFFPAQLVLGASGNIAAFFGLLAASWVMQAFGAWACLSASIGASSVGCVALFFLAPLPEVDKPQSFRDAISFDVRMLMSIPAFSIPVAFDYYAVYEYTVQYIPDRYNTSTPVAGWIITPAKLLPALTAFPVALYSTGCAINVQLAMAAGLLFWQAMFSALLGWSGSLAMFGLMLAAASLGTLLPHFARALISSTSSSTQRTGIFVTDQVAGLLSRFLSAFAMERIIYYGNHKEPRRPEWPYIGTAIASLIAFTSLCLIWGSRLRRERRDH